MFFPASTHTHTYTHFAYLITVGVISAQKKMLRLLTAWEENMPMMEKATEKFLFSVPESSAGGAGDTVYIVSTRGSEEEAWSKRFCVLKDGVQHHVKL